MYYIRVEFNQFVEIYNDWFLKNQIELLNFLIKVVNVKNIIILGIYYFMNIS